jgi:hypothetical protein
MLPHLSEIASPWNQERGKPTPSLDRRERSGKEARPVRELPPLPSPEATPAHRGSPPRAGLSRLRPTPRRAASLCDGVAGVDGWRIGAWRRDEGLQPPLRPPERAPPTRVGPCRGQPAGHAGSTRPRPSRRGPWPAVPASHRRCDTKHRTSGDPTASSCGASEEPLRGERCTETCIALSLHRPARRNFFSCLVERKGIEPSTSALRKPRFMRFIF